MRGGLNRVLLFLACGLAAVSAAAGSEIVDDFNDGVVDPSIWQHLASPPGCSAREANGRLEIYNDGTENGIAGVRTRAALPGEASFRVQVSFDASECANESALSLSVHNANPDHTAQHVFIANGFTDERKWAVGWNARMNDETGTFQEELTSDVSGVFYITYEAGIVHLSHTGYGAENAMRTVDTADWTHCTHVYVALEVWADGHLLSGPGAWFDDFYLREDPGMEDLKGVWSVHGLISGNGPPHKPGWYWLSMEMDSTGEAWARTPVHDSLENAFYVPVLGQFSVDSQGIITNSQLESYSGAMAANADMIVGVGTVIPGSSAGVNGESLEVLVKQGSRFTTSDLTGTWWVHGLISGDDASWRPGWYWHAIDIDSDGHPSATSAVTDSLGNSYYLAKWGPQEPFVIDPAGTITNPRLSTYRGTMTSGKDLIVSVVTMAPGAWEDVRGYNLQVLVKQGLAFTTEDLAGAWFVHGLSTASSAHRTGWFCGEMEVQASGALSASFVRSDSRTASISDIATISDDGVITLADRPSAHGVLSADRDLAVLTMTETPGRHDLLLLTRAPGSTWHDPNDGEPPVTPGVGPVSEDFETRDFSRFAWRHEGDAFWSISSDERHSGLYSARAGAIGDAQKSILKVTRNGSASAIRFYVKTSSESGYDKLVFEIDGQPVGEWSGATDWRDASFMVAAGNHSFAWSYIKDGSESAGEDTAWLDDIVFP